VPEVIAARHAGLRVAGISVIANAYEAASPIETTHEDVQAAVAAAAANVRIIVEGLAEYAGA
jgi:xanthosine phosphorylase